MKSFYLGRKFNNLVNKTQPDLAYRLHFVGTLFEHDYKMVVMKAFIVKKHISLNATPAEVWRALTKPEKTKEYFFNARVISQWKEGSPITFKGKMFWIIPFEMKGKILRIIPEKLLQYTLKNWNSGSISTVTDELEYKNGKTVLSIADNVGTGPDAEKRYKRSVKGWEKVLKGLKALVEAKQVNRGGKSHK